MFRRKLEDALGQRKHEVVSVASKNEKEVPGRHDGEDSNASYCKKVVDAMKQDKYPATQLQKNVLASKEIFYERNTTEASWKTMLEKVARKMSK